MRNEDRDVVVTEIQSRVLAACVRQSTHPDGIPLDVLVNDTLYHELKRLENHPGAPLHDDDVLFWKDIKRRLGKVDAVGLRTLIARIIRRFTKEILGNFNPTVYTAVTKLVPRALPLLLNGMSVKRLIGRRSIPSLDKTISVEGHLDGLRRSMEQGTVILTPTHVSNMDSLVVGWALQQLGLPPFTYGAGLNLFSNPVTSFFLRNLGAYRVDRLKTAPLYKDVLKEYATMSIELGQPNLFFPAGTRVRSGKVEERLKLGLLSSGLKAYINNRIAGRPKPKVFIVPCNLNYHVVLEAETLIEDHLKKEGKGRYIISDDAFSRPQMVLRFMQKIFHLDSRITMTIGAPLDPFGNQVDHDGRSQDSRGRPIDIDRYILRNGVPVHVPQRDRTYTQEAGAAIAEAFQCGNVAMSTHLVAFTVFEMLKKQHRHLNLYRLLRTAGDGAGIEMGRLAQAVGQVKNAVNDLAALNKIRRDDRVAHSQPIDIVHDALKHFASFHTQPALTRRGDRVFPTDMNLVLYYRNRLSSYPTLKAAIEVKHG